MSKLQAQMSLLGRIDEIVCHGELENGTVNMIESFLPGTTGVGQQGWFRELKYFLEREELAPLDRISRQPLADSNPVEFPSYENALSELKAEPMDDEKPASPATQSRAIFAATILSIADRMERDAGKTLPAPPGWTSPEPVPDPLDDLVPTFARNTSEPFPPIPGIDTEFTGDPIEDLKIGLRSTRSRADYLNVTQFISRNVADPVLADVLNRPVVCTGALRKIGGKFCTLLTTSWDSPFTLKQIKAIIDPLNWPDMCDFFVSMDPQPPRQPDLSAGWSRVLEGVSGDKTQWEMLTALRYWNGVMKNADDTETGVYVNYDLDNPPRVGDCKLVEVDAGYIWATPQIPGDPNSLVKLRTCKQVRIRGVSSTATAALACGFGWGDAMSQMFTEGVEDPDPPVDRKAFAESVPQQVVITHPSNQKKPGDDEPTDEEIEAAADEVELIPGWRGAIIKAMRVQVSDGIDRAKKLGTEFAVQWSDGDGFGLDDVNKFGTDVGSEMTQYATNMFKAAAAALQPPPKNANAGADGGND
jgi:hypothetical protein